MKLPKDFPKADALLKRNLNALIERIGVPLEPFVDPDIETRGIPVKPDDFKVAQNGTLEYQGLKVVLYMRDMKGSLPKYHVVNCQTVKEMDWTRKYKRYVVTRRTDGEFTLNFPDNDPHNRQKTCRLDICKNCLWQELKLSYPVDAFPLADWFNAIDPSYQPPPIEPLYDPGTTRDVSADLCQIAEIELLDDPRTPITDDVSKYPPNWNLLSLQCRERAGWRCEECGIDLSLKLSRKFLHAHHLRGTQYNQLEDLRALCIGCHAEQPGHQMEHLPDYLEFMDKHRETWEQLKIKK